MEQQIQDTKNTKWITLGHLLAVVLTVSVFLFSIDMLGASFARMSGGVTDLIISAVRNPSISLFIGILLTAILQSSSTTTAMVVAFVASGILDFNAAIPIVMGANIGTTLTNLLVALGFIAQKGQFRKAFATGSIHGIFNIFLVLLLFPLEYYYHFLSGLALKVADLLPNAEPSATNQLFAIENTLVTSVSRMLEGFVDSNLLPLVVSLGLLFGSIKLMSRVSSHIMGKSQRKYYQYVFESPLKSFAWGTLLTGALQSSTMTTTVLVPLVATKKVNLKEAFPFIVGANVGTTVTALLAALFKSEAAISIALVHLFFNLIGVLIFLPFAAVREMAVKMATEMGRKAQKYRMLGFVYIIVVFFLMPFTLIYFNKSTAKKSQVVPEKHEENTGLPQEPAFRKFDDLGG